MISIISATKEEVQIFLNEVVSSEIKYIDDVEVIQGIFLNERVSIIISGVGIKKAKNAATIAATKYKPRYIVSTGFSGALVDNLKVGDLVVGEEVLSLKEERKIKLFSDLPYIPFDYKKGKILTKNRFINNKREKKALYNRSGAISVDMETWGIASISVKHGINIVSIRAISDNLDFSLPSMGKLFNSNQKLDLQKSIKYFLSYPQYIFSFLRFKFYHLRKAKIQLNHFLTVLIPILVEIDS